MAARYGSGYLVSRRRGAALSRRSLGDRGTPSPGISPHPKALILSRSGRHITFSRVAADQRCHRWMRRRPIREKSTAYKPLPITPRNTDATWRVRSPFAFAGSNIVRMMTAPCCSKSSVRFQIAGTARNPLTVQGDGRSVQAGRTISRGVP
jgi:hypothetical protein